MAITIKHLTKHTKRSGALVAPGEEQGFTDVDGARFMLKNIGKKALSVRVFDLSIYGYGKKKKARKKK